MNIGMACLIGNLIDAVSGLNGGRTEKMSEGVWSNGIRICTKYSVYLSAAQGSAPAANKQVRAVSGRAV